MDGVRERESDRQKERMRKRETELKKERKRETARQRQRDRERERERERGGPTEASDVQHSDEVGGGLEGEALVDPGDHVVEQPAVHRLGQRVARVVGLLRLQRNPAETQGIMGVELSGPKYTHGPTAEPCDPVIQ